MNMQITTPVNCVPRSETRLYMSNEAALCASCLGNPEERNTTSLYISLISLFCLVLFIFLFYAYGRQNKNSGRFVLKIGVCTAIFRRWCPRKISHLLYTTRFYYYIDAQTVSLFSLKYSYVFSPESSFINFEMYIIVLLLLLLLLLNII